VRFQPKPVLLLLALFLVGAGVAWKLGFIQPTGVQQAGQSGKPLVEVVNPMAEELALSPGSVPASAQKTFAQWMNYIHRIDQNEDASLTYARDIALTLSTVGEQHWKLSSKAGVYEDAGQQKVLMREVDGSLMRHVEGQEDATVLKLKAAFAHYDAEKQYVTLYGRSKITLNP
jgi:hypothetical protein